MSIVYHSIHTFLLRILSVAAGFVITLITARLLDVSGRGTFAMLAVATSIFITFFGGISPAIVYQVANKKRNPHEVFHHAITFAALIGGFTSIVLLILHPWLRSLNWGFLIYFAVAAPFLLVNSYLGGALLGINAIKTMNYIALAPYLFTLGPWGLLIVAKAFDLHSALISWAISYALTTVVALIWLRSYFMSFRVAYDRELTRQMVGFGSKIGAVNLVGILNYRIDMLLVEFFLGIETVGIYSIAVAVAEFLWFISSSISTAAYTRIGQLSPAEAGSLTVRLLRVSIVLIAATSLVLAIAGYFLIPFVFGEQYRGAITSFEILIPGVAFYGTASILSTYFTSQMGKPELSFYIASLSFIINLIISIALIPRMGMVGGAIATTASYILSVLVSLALFLKTAKVKASELIMKPSDVSNLVQYVNFWTKS